MKHHWTGLLVLNLWAASQNPAVAQLFTQPANATGNLQRVGMDSGTITPYQLMRLNYIGPGQSAMAMRQWANLRRPNQVAMTTRYPFAVGPNTEYFKLEDQPETCVRLWYSNKRYTGYNFVSCPMLEGF